MPDVSVFCVRANSGQYTSEFVADGFAGIGWFDDDLDGLDDLAALRERFQQRYPEISNNAARNQVGQVARFLFEIRPGDYIITPGHESEKLYYGVVQSGGPFFRTPDPGRCPYAQRIPVEWASEPIIRHQLSVPLQNTLRAMLTVYRVANPRSFFESIGHADLVPPDELSAQRSTVDFILDQVLELDDQEFEELVTQLLNAMGFDAERTGRVGDGGVDAIGDLNLSNLAQIRLYVQVKRYQRSARINANTVKALRQNIPAGAQGAFITTASYQRAALEVAIEPGFPRIGTIDGEQLVDLLTEHWDQLDLELREKLGLRRGLVPS